MNSSVAATRAGMEHQDLVDDADYAASQTIAASSLFGVTSVHDYVQETEARSVEGESVNEFEVVFIKDNVAVHPSPVASHRINGCLRLLKAGPSVFMDWVPYTQRGLSEGACDSAVNDRHLYTIQNVSLAQIRSIRRHTPPLGWQYVIIVLTTGLAFPPFYFHNGGIREFLTTLREYVHIVRSADDANLFLVNDYSQDPLQRSLTSLELRDVLPTTALCGKDQDLTALKYNERLISGSANVPIKSKENYFTNHDKCEMGASYPSQTRSRRDPARDISIQVLEKFSLVTKFARDTTAQLFGESRLLGNGDALEELSHIYEPRKASELKQALQETASLPLVEGDKNLQDFANAQSMCLLDPITTVTHFPPLSLDEWLAFTDNEGRSSESQILKRRIFYGGVEPRLRCKVWKYLLGYYPYDSTCKEREELAIKKREQYQVLKAQWETISDEQARRFTKFRERKSRIEKDVVRTDRSFAFYEGDDNPNIAILRDILITYSFYNFDLGYCQGMSDLLSPILYVMGDEVEAFWCFACLMEHLAPNFHRDQNGMHSQLLALSKLVELLDNQLHNYFKQADCLNYFFCFRWILIQFKREFTYEDVLRLWESLWTNYITEHLHLYISVAILMRHRTKIIEEQMDFDTLLKFINELSGHIDLQVALRDAETLFIKAGELGTSCIPPGTPPSLQPVQMT